MSKEFGNKVLDLIKKKLFHTYEYMSTFEKFKQLFPSKEQFYSSLVRKKISDKDFEHVLNVWNKFEKKTMKDYLHLKCYVLFLANLRKKYRGNPLKMYGSFPSQY